MCTGFYFFCISNEVLLNRSQARKPGQMLLEKLLLGSGKARVSLAGRGLLKCPRHEQHASYAPDFMYDAPALGLC